MGWLQIIRLSVLLAHPSPAWAILCGIIAGGISAHITAFAVENFREYYIFSIMGLVSGGLTIITVPIMLIIDLVRTGAFTSLVVVELSWLTVLWILWLVTGAITANDTSQVFATCEFAYAILNQLCHETQAVEAFAFLAWLVLFAYTILLLVVALVNASRGAPMWRATVRQAGRIAPSPGKASAGAFAPQKAEFDQSAFAPQQQHSPLAMGHQPQHQPLLQGQQPPPQMQQTYPPPMSTPVVPMQHQQQPYAPQPAPSPASNTRRDRKRRSVTVALPLLAGTIVAKAFVRWQLILDRLFKLGLVHRWVHP
ncbi:hypothetical protein C8Q80DRAFT_1123004 [Daedaleopsis nitida]|nr:hypothetical protein C8Q80DRAFT_1123004 [Daedaleopsis nitida]